MVMEAGSPEVTLVPGLLERVHGLVALCKTVAVHQDKCKPLAQYMEGLLPFLQEIKTSQTKMSGRANQTFRDLMYALLRTERLMEEIKRTPKVKRMWLHAHFAEKLSKATSDILVCINNLPMVQFKISAEKEEEIKELKLKLEKLGAELKDTGPNKDAHDLEAEFAKVLRAQTNGEATTSTGGGRVMDHLLQWLAIRFDSDVETVRREWQETKDEVLFLREQVERTTENKRQLEDDFLRQLIVYSEKGLEETNQPLADASSSFSRGGSLPPEFECTVCSEVLEDPVVCASGHTFCRKCITKWYDSKSPGFETCPFTNSRVSSRILIQNITLRRLIQRWDDGKVGSLQHPINIGVSGGTAPRPTVKVPVLSSKTVEPSGSEGSTRSLSPSKNGGIRSLTPSNSQTQSVDILISSLQSDNSMEVMKTLKQLTTIAEHSSGQWEIYSAHGIPAIVELLDSDNQAILERVAGVLEALTDEVNVEHPIYEEREQIFSTVCFCGIDSLIKLMHDGSQLARLRAAQTVVNLMVDGDSRDEISRREGVVTGLFQLTNVSYVLFSMNAGKSLCIKGLSLLGGEKSSSSSNTDLALTAALIHLAGSLIATPKLVEEVLLALSSLVEMAGAGVCSTLLTKNDIFFLIRLYRPSRSFSRRGHSYSQTSLLTEVGKKELLDILEVWSLAEGQPQVLVECGLITHLLPKITDPEAGEDFLTKGVKVLRRCISSTRQKSAVHFQIDFQCEMKGVVGILERDEIPADIKLDLLSILIHLCTEREVEPLRESFLNTGGVAALEGLGRSPVVALKESVARMVCLLAEFHPRRKELRTTGATILLINLLADDSVECRCRAVVAAASIIKSDDWDMSFDGVRFEQLVDLLLPKYPPECQEAAICVLSKAAQKLLEGRGHSDVNIFREKKTIHLLLDVVRHKVDASAKSKAAEILINLVVKEHLMCSALEKEGLIILKEFGVARGGEFHQKVVQLMNAFSQESDDTRNYVMEVDGVPLLMNALENGRKKEEACIASIALTSLVTYLPGREAAIQAGLIEKAIICISRRNCSCQLLGALEHILNKRVIAERIRTSGGVQCLVRILSLPIADMVEKRLAASVLAKLLKLDQESLPILGQEKGISSLKDLLTVQARETNPSLYGSRMEALEALCEATEDKDNLEHLLKEECIELLLYILSRESVSPENEKLVLILLWKLSRAALELCVSVNFMVENISRQVFRVICTASTSTESSIDYAIRIVRNLSLFGVNEKAAMLGVGEGAVKVLLDRISLCDGAGSAIVHNCVMALERFILDDKGRVAFITEGIPLMVKVLKMDVSGKAKSYASRNLVMVASDEHSSREVCNAIWQDRSEFFPAVKDILEHGPSSECKGQAAMLLNYVIRFGPSADVCRSIREFGIIPKLKDMTADPDCEGAVEALDAFKKHEKDSKHSSIWSRFR